MRRPFVICAALPLKKFKVAACDQKNTHTRVLPGYYPGSVLEYEYEIFYSNMSIFKYYSSTA